MKAQCPSVYTVLEEQLEDDTRTHFALQRQYGELSADLKHELNRLWKQNVELSTQWDRS